MSHPRRSALPCKPRPLARAAALLGLAGPGITGLGAMLGTSLGVTLGLSASPALAQGADDPSPYYIGASQGFSRRNNVFGTSDGTPRFNDTVSTTSVLGGFDQPFGRQRVYANGNVNYNRYSDQSQLNNNGFGLNAGLDWSTIERLSGTLRYTANQSLADYSLADVARTTGRNTQRTQDMLATVRYGAGLRVGLEGTLQHRSIDYSAVQYASQEYTQDVASLGLIWGMSGQLTLGTTVRFTKSDYPQSMFVSGGTLPGYKSDRRDFDLTFNWVPTGITTLSGRLSYTKEDYGSTGRPDFSGFTGSVNAAYSATGRLSLVAGLSRDTGSETNFLNAIPTAPGETPGVPVVTPTQSVSNRVTTAANLGATYSLTSKIGLNAYASMGRSTRAVTSTDDGDERYRSLGLGASYQVTRNIGLGCSIDASRRRADGQAFAFNVRQSSFGCTGTITLR